MTDLPAELSALAGTLRVLWLDDNALTELPASVLELTHLEKLRLSRNKVGSIPPQVRMLQALTELALDNNELVELPVTVGDLPELRYLNVRQNKLVALPDLGDLSKLTILAASSNALVAPPPGLERLANLEEAYFNGNNMTAFPEGCLFLKELRVLNVANNAITWPLPEAASAAYGPPDAKGAKLDASQGRAIGIEVTVRGNPCAVAPVEE